MNQFVSLTKENALKEKMAALGIRDQDIEEKFVRSSAPGGQNVNKTSTCVHVKHVPTGMEVKCMKERSQALNRFLARKMLVEKIEDFILGRESQKAREIEKIRRQKRRRSRRAKEKILENKHKQSEKKRQRSYVPEAEY
jgi:protein subunit release factor B